MNKYIQTVILPLNDLPNAIAEFTEKEFDFPLTETKEKITTFLKSFKPALFTFIEYPYVDKIYRDSYYSFFSSKHKDYLRNCIRVSFFDKEINNDDFRSEEKIKNLLNHFLGFISIRPTYPQIIGTTKLSPEVLVDSDFYCCLVKNNSSVNGVKLNNYSFPHASQDAETITCAETSVWSIMEYFGTKYPEYKTILPSVMNEHLASISYERLIPSRGLSIATISYLLKQFGFGSRLYSREAYNDADEFKKILDHYIESGIPVIVNIKNHDVNHAVIFIGHQKIKTEEIENAQPSLELQTANNKLEIIETSIFIKEYVIIDDNHSPYKLGSFKTPAEYYNPDNSFYTSEITNFVVPLYKKIYLESWQAYKLIKTILKQEIIGYTPSTGDFVILRFFLTSSRSFKNKIACNNMDILIKELIINTSMPKFVWIAELSNKQLYKEGKANGLIIIDATSNDMIRVTESLVFIIYPDKYIEINKKVEKIINNINLKPFDIYINNLMGGPFQCQV